MRGLPKTASAEDSWKDHEGKTVRKEGTRGKCDDQSEESASGLESGFDESMEPFHHATGLTDSG